MLKAYKYRLYPNVEQRVQIAKHIGNARFVYNWALGNKIKAWSVEKKNLTKFDLVNDLPKLKAKEETKWLNEVNSQSLQQAIFNLDRAYKRFFKEKKGFPKFKAKYDTKQSYQVPQHVTVDFKTGVLCTPKLKPMKIKFHRKFKGTVKTVTISKTPTNKYYASILVETEDSAKPKVSLNFETTLGIDLGVKTFATLSTGEKIENPKILKQYEHSLARRQKQFSRKKGVSNRNKSKLKVAKVYEKISNVRQDFLHKLSHRLTHENQVDTIVIEDLSVNNMVKNHKLAKSISDCSWSEFRRQLTYKSDWYGKNLIVINRFEPSSKLCSACGTINHKLTLKDRDWVCESCGTKHDRDVNASINIKHMGLHPRNFVPAERRELTLGESQGRNTTRRTKKPQPFRVR